MTEDLKTFCCEGCGSWEERGFCNKNNFYCGRYYTCGSWIKKEKNKCEDNGMKIDFFVPGVPAPGGSKRAFFNPKTKRVNVVDTCKRNKPWRSQVSAFAKDAMEGKSIIIEKPVLLNVTFVMPRPKNHYGTGKNSSKLKSSSPLMHIKKPDATKLLRALEDALTGIIWKDDAYVARSIVEKKYGEKTGAHVEISLLGE